MSSAVSAALAPKVCRYRRSSPTTGTITVFEVPQAPVSGGARVDAVGSEVAPTSRTRRPRPARRRPPARRASQRDGDVGGAAAGLDQEVAGGDELARGGQRSSGGMNTSATRMPKQATRA